MNVAVRAPSSVVMGAKKNTPWSLADALSQPLGGRELLNGAAPDRPKPLTPEQYDKRSLKFPKVRRQG